MFCQSVIFLVLFGLFPFIYSDFGGHDLYTSLAQLEVLWHNERRIIDEMKGVLGVNDNVTQAIHKYNKQYEQLGLEVEPNYDFLGHPINAYLFVRHVAHGWSFIKDSLEPINVNDTNDFKNLIEREKEKLPSLQDVSGAAFGLVRLHNMYKYNLTDFIEHGIISATLDNGQVVRSKPSILKLTSYDINLMAFEAGSNGLYDSACDLMKAAIKLAEDEIRQGVDLSWLFGYKIDLKEMNKTFQTLMKVHDHYLDNRGMKSRVHRCHQYPYDKKLRKKKKFKKEFTYDQILTREKLQHYEEQGERDNELQVKGTFIGEVQMDDLCRGKQLRSPETLGKLYCTYVNGGSPWLKLGPLKMEINAFDPYHVVIRELLFENECDDITEFLGPKLDFPPGRMNRRSRKNDWTMKNCWPNETENVGLEKLNRRIEHLTGLHADSSRGFSEGFMCGNYGIGGYYFIHPDFHPYGTPSDFIPGAIGNRVSTILTVLESPEAGGATVWPYAGITIFPEKGSAAWWYNLRKSSLPDQFTKHAACPVLLGQKWIGNKWVGYNAQWNGRSCGLGTGDEFEGVFK